MRSAPLPGALALAACASPSTPPVVAPPSPYVVAGISPSQPPGWREETPLAALDAVRAACRVKPSAVCNELQRSGIPNRETARRFLETRFVAQAVANTPEGPGLLTGYFSPEYAARTEPDEIYNAALRPLPPAPLATPTEVAALIEWAQLANTGIGYVDAQLLASARSLPEGRLLTLDGRLQAQAERLGIGYPG